MEININNSVVDARCSISKFSVFLEKTSAFVSFRIAGFCLFDSSALSCAILRGQKPEKLVMLATVILRGHSG